MRRTFIGVAVSTICLFVASTAGLAYQLATDDEDDAEAAGRPSSTTTTTTATTTTRAASEDDEQEQTAPQVRLVDPGAEPRREMRLRLVAGSTTRTLMESRVTLVATVDGEALPQNPASGFRAVLVQRVTRVDGNGTADVELTYTGVEAVTAAGTSPDQVEGMNDALSDLEGLTGTARIDSRGRVLEMSTDSDRISNPVVASAIESFSSQIQSLSAPFPVEPVGVGARWTYTAAANIMGFTLRSTFQYTLSALDGDDYELDATSTSDAPEQPSALGGIAGLISGDRQRVEKFDIRSAATVGGSLTEPFRSTGVETGQGDIAMEITTDGTTQRIDMHIETENRLARA